MPHNQSHLFKMTVIYCVLTILQACEKNPYPPTGVKKIGVLGIAHGTLHHC